ncbi:MAG: FAD-binding oxidoreductase, partial [Bacteroidota bacterium]
AAPVLDAVDLFVGAEGTLGAIGEVELALVPAPAAWFGGLAFFPTEESALDFVRLVRDERPADAAACRPAVLEYFDRAALDLADRSGRRREIGLPAMPHEAGAAVYFEQGCGADELETLFAAYDRVLAMCGSSADAVWSALEEREQAKLKSLRHLVPEEVNRLVAENRRHCPAIHKVGTDLSVPNAALEALVRAYRTRLAEEGIPAVVFGHLGENNLHVNMLPRDEEELGRAKALHREWASLAVSLGGTVAAEHGIGRLKGELLHLLYGPGELAQMAAVKRALDPGGILNPGHVLSNP